MAPTWAVPGLFCITTKGEINLQNVKQFELKFEKKRLEAQFGQSVFSIVKRG